MGNALGDSAGGSCTIYTHIQEVIHSDQQDVHVLQKVAEVSFNAWLETVQMPLLSADTLQTLPRIIEFALHQPHNITSTIVNNLKL